jgi:hypothetical protein
VENVALEFVDPHSLTLDRLPRASDVMFGRARLTQDLRFNGR